MFNLGFGEIAVICIVLIIAVGPDRLPTMMKGLGKTIRTVRQASRDIRATVGIDELMREDVMAPLPRRPPPKAAVPRPASVPAALPGSEATASAAAAAAPPQAPAGTVPTENARPASTIEAAGATETAAGIPGTPSAQPAPAQPAPLQPAAAPAQGLGAAPLPAVPEEPEPRKD